MMITIQTCFVVHGTMILLIHVRVVKPSEQKCAGFIHYTNLNTTDFYGEKFALEAQGYNPATTIGEAKNFKLHLPWLMWHKKTSKWFW